MKEKYEVIQAAKKGKTLKITPKPDKVGELQQMLDDDEESKAKPYFVPIKELKIAS